MATHSALLGMLLQMVGWFDMSGTEGISCLQRYAQIGHPDECHDTRCEMFFRLECRSFPCVSYPLPVCVCRLLSVPVDQALGLRQIRQQSLEDPYDIRSNVICSVKRRVRNQVEYGTTAKWGGRLGASLIVASEGYTY